MRLLFTSTFLTGTLLSIGFGWAQTVPVVDLSNDTAAKESLFSTRQTPILRGSEPFVEGANRAALANREVLPTAANTPVRPVAPVQPLQGPGRVAPDAIDLYTPIGLRAGSFVLYPSISIFAEATDNIDGGSPAQVGKSGTVEVELHAESDWDRHKLDVDARAGLVGYQEPSRKPNSNYGLDSELELELADQTALTLTGNAQIQREAANNAELVASGGSASVQTSLSAGAVLDQGAGLMRFQLRGTLASEAYDEDASRDFKTYTLGGRIGYQATDQVTPFVDLEASRKVYDTGANTQNGDSLRGSIGIEVANREKLSGEASVGVMAWRPEANGQKNDAIVFADASLTWSPNPLWTLTGGVETSLSSSSTAATSVATHAMKLSADFAVRRDLLLRGEGTLSHETYRGTNRRDWLLDATLSAEYSLNRSVQLIARVGHQERDSSEAGADYSSNTIEFGLKLQH